MTTLPNAITGIDDHLSLHLASAIRRSDSIRLIVSFVRESGARLLAPELKSAAQRGASLRLLTGRYLSITEPSALYCLMHELGTAIDMRFYNGSVEAFHPKAYILDSGHEAEVFVGSSNMSRSALTGGVEWNYRFTKAEHPDDYSKFSATFDALFDTCSEPVTRELLKSYASAWKKPALLRAATEADEVRAHIYHRAARASRTDRSSLPPAGARRRRQGSRGRGHGRWEDPPSSLRLVTKRVPSTHRQEIAEQA